MGTLTPKWEWDPHSDPKVGIERHGDPKVGTLTPKWEWDPTLTPNQTQNTHPDPTL